MSTGRGAAHSTLPMNVLIPRAPDVTSLHDAPPWTSVVTHADDVVHPPLYWLSLRVWRTWFGEPIPTARLLSVLFSALSIVALFAAVRALSGTNTSLWAAL